MRGDFATVVAGGVIGGVFWIITQILGADSLNLPFGIYAYGILGGVLAAGVTAYIPDNVDLENLKRLFFVSAAAGLSFPAVISTAVNAEDLASIRKTARDIDRSVVEVSEELSKSRVNPAEVSKSISQASVAVNSGVARAQERDQLEAVGRQAIESLAAEADTARNPAAYVKAIEKIGTATPSLKLESTAKLIELAESERSSVATAAAPAKDRNIAALPQNIENAVRQSTEAQSQEATNAARLQRNRP
ncbi:MAG: hypothetical protein AAF941_06515 [Pseudomonadota bacterium]